MPIRTKARTHRAFVISIGLFLIAEVIREFYIRTADGHEMPELPKPGSTRRSILQLMRAEERPCPHFDPTSGRRSLQQRLCLGQPVLSIGT